MRIFFSLLASLSIIAVGFAIAAADKVAAPAIQLPSSATPTAVPTAPPPAPVVVAPPPVIATLKDGSKIEMESDGSVQVLNADGTKTPVPDGVLTLRDNTTFAVKGGKRVDE